MTTYLGGGISAEDLDLLANTVGNNLTVLVVNNTNTTRRLAMVLSNKATSQNEQAALDTDPYSIKVLGLSDTYARISVTTTYDEATMNVFASIYDAAAGSYVHVKKYNVTDQIFSIGSTNTILQGGVMLVSFNGV